MVHGHQNHHQNHTSEYNLIVTLYGSFFKVSHHVCIAKRWIILNSCLLTPSQSATSEQCDYCVFENRVDALGSAVYNNSCSVKQFAHVKCVEPEHFVFQTQSACNVEFSKTTKRISPSEKLYLITWSQQQHHVTLHFSPLLTAFWCTTAKANRVNSNLQDFLSAPETSNDYNNVVTTHSAKTTPPKQMIQNVLMNSCKARIDKWMVQSAATQGDKHIASRANKKFH